MAACRVARGIVRFTDTVADIDRGTTDQRVGRHVEVGGAGAVEIGRPLRAAVIEAAGIKGTRRR